MCIDGGGQYYLNFTPLLVVNELPQNPKKLNEPYE